MKKFVISTLTACLLFGTVAYAGTHHGSNQHSKTKTTWHKSTTNYDGHYSNQCTSYDHVWHAKTDEYKAHYSYACSDYGHDYNHDVCNNGYHN